jgi:putative oxidoreductase
MLSYYANTVLNPLLLRAMLAAIFIFHGYNLVGGDTELGSNWMPKELAQPAPVQMAAAWGELVGGIALAFGFLTRIAALGIIAIMVGAIAQVHWPNGFDITKHGYEYNLAIITMCACLVLGGPGPIAVDRWFSLRRQRE